MSATAVTELPKPAPETAPETAPEPAVTTATVHENGPQKRSCCKSCWHYWNFIFAVLLPLSLFGILFPYLFHHEREIAELAAGAFTLLLMVPLWVTTAVPLPVTSLIPIFMGPIFGLMDSDYLVRNYLNDIIFLFVGGISVALSFEFSNLHKRLALRVILLTGTSPKMLLLGIMMTTAVLSLFMNNTSVTTLVCPIVMALMDSLEHCIRNYMAEEFSKTEPPKDEIPPEDIESTINDTIDEDAISKAKRIKKTSSSVSSKSSRKRTKAIPAKPVTPNKKTAEGGSQSSNIQSKTSIQTKKIITKPKAIPMTDKAKVQTPNVNKTPGKKESQSSVNKSNLKQKSASRKSVNKKNVKKRNNKVFPAEHHEATISDVSESSSVIKKQEIAIPSQQEHEWSLNKAIVEKNMEIFIRNTKLMLLLGTAYSANLSGTGMVTGTGTNLVLMMDKDKHRVSSKNDGDMAEPTVLNWSGLALPPMIANLIFCYFFIYFWFTRRTKCFSKSQMGTSAQDHGHGSFVVTAEIQEVLKKSLRQSYNNLGGLRLHEGLVLMIFGLLVVLWFFEDMDKENQTGWAYMWAGSLPSLATPAGVTAILCFVIPRKPSFYRSICKCEFRKTKFETVLEWWYLQHHYPWGALMILSGGFAMSEIVRESGLDKEITEMFFKLPHMPPYVFLLVTMSITLVFTAVTENTAAVAILLPIYFQLSRKFKWHPMLLTFSATLVGSHAFVFPVSTLPNAIVYTAGHMRVWDIFIPGFFITIGTSCFDYEVTASGTCPKGGDVFES